VTPKKRFLPEQAEKMSKPSSTDKQVIPIAVAAPEAAPPDSADRR
jgi:hypothetical protein